MHMRRFSFLLAIILCLMMFPESVITVNAAYENTYANTGNQRADIIGVAKTQLGYIEGGNNYTKYGEFFNRPNDPWCGWFISWCAAQAGIPTGVLRRQGKANPNSFGIPYYHGSSYRPQSGDLFFRVDSDGAFAHAGLVYYTSGEYFYTLEGNTYTGNNPEGVYSRQRKISDFYFGVPSYKGGGSHSYSTGYDKSHPHKEYRYCSHCDDKYYTGNSTTSSDCSVCAQELCSHSYGSWEQTDNGKHTRGCTKCGKTVTERHNWTVRSIIKEPTCSINGAQLETCNICNAEQTTVIPATEVHTYDEAIYLNNNNHIAVCTTCHEEETLSHIRDDLWTCDSQSHWQFCAACGERCDIEPHSFPNGCLSKCEICGYLPEGGHIVETDYLFDDQSHWQICSICMQTFGTEDHVYSSECDTSCNICSNQRTTVSQHSFKFDFNSSSHWQICELCDTLQSNEPHTPDNNVQDWEIQRCTTCGFETRSELEHVHAYQTIEYDEKSHWGQCKCGTILYPEGHSWSMESGRCSICGTVNAVFETPQNYSWVWVAIATAISMGTIGVITIFIVNSAKRRSYNR